MKPTLCLRKAASPVIPLKRSTKLPQASRARLAGDNASRADRPPGPVAAEPQQTPRPRFAAASDPRLSESSSTMRPSRRYALFLSMLAGGGIACYCAFLFMSYRRLPESSDLLQSQSTSNIPGDVRSQADVSSRFDALAKDYDNQVGQSEWVMGLKKRRRKLIAEAKGHVLEVGVGTARNTTFYAEELDRQAQQASKSGRKADKDALKGSTSHSRDSTNEGKGIKSLTFVDKSAQMIMVAQDKWEQEEKHRQALAKKRGLWTSVPGRLDKQGVIEKQQIRWIVADAENVDEIPPAEGMVAESAQENNKSGQTASSGSFTSSMERVKGFFGYDQPSTHHSRNALATGPSEANGTYDTIIETFGLCSTLNPITLLNSLGQLCKKSPHHDATNDEDLKSPNQGEGSQEGSQEGGRILLLEHGRSYYDWMNYLLDISAPGHADQFGCWHNRDIGKLVEDSELEVVSIKRYNLGTTWEMVLRPRP